jgi:hypothetical protein
MNKAPQTTVETLGKIAQHQLTTKRRNNYLLQAMESRNMIGTLLDMYTGRRDRAHLAQQVKEQHACEDVLRRWMLLLLFACETGKNDCLGFDLK